MTLHDKKQDMMKSKGVFALRKLVYTDCFTNSMRTNMDVVIRRKQELVSAFPLCEHRRADMNEQGF